MKKINTILSIVLLGSIFIVSCKSKQKVKENYAKVKADNFKEIPFTIILQEEHSNIKAPKKTVITNRESLQEVFSVINRTRRPGLATPKVDFDLDQVIAFFLGEKSTGGYTVNIDKIISENKEVVVYYSIQKPKGMASMVLTQPILLVSMPKTEESVKFVEVK